jgi:hypothetical protein
MAGALEKRWFPATQAFTADGTANGVVTVADTFGFYTNQVVVVSATGQQTLSLKVKIVLSPTQLTVGTAQGGVLGEGTNISAYTVAANAMITAAGQTKPMIQPPEIFNGVYEHDPVVAFRSKLVDKYGTSYDAVTDSNGLRRLAVDAAITVESVEIGSVDQGNPNTIANGWPVKITDGTNVAKVNPDGSLDLVEGGASSPTIFNVSAAVAGTEYSQALPANTKRFSMQVRNNTAALQFAFVSGQSGTNYILLPRGASYEAYNLLTTSLSVYFQTNKNGQTVEILAWV